MAHLNLEVGESDVVGAAVLEPLVIPPLTEGEELLQENDAARVARDGAHSSVACAEEVVDVQRDHAVESDLPVVVVVAEVQARVEVVWCKADALQPVVGFKPPLSRRVGLAVARLPKEHPGIRRRSEQTERFGRQEDIDLALLLSPLQERGGHVCGPQPPAV